MTNNTNSAAYQARLAQLRAHCRAENAAHARLIAAGFTPRGWDQSTGKTQVAKYADNAGPNDFPLWVRSFDDFAHAAAVLCDRADH